MSSFGIQSLRATAAATLGLALAILFPLMAALGYVGQNPYSVHLAAPSSARCDQAVTITATVRSAETGALQSGQSVFWTVAQGQSAGDSVSPQNTVTDAAGKASTTLRFVSAEGKRVVQATIAQWPATISVTCAGGVPPTPTPTQAPTPAPTLTPTSPGPPGASTPAITPLVPDQTGQPTPPASDLASPLATGGQSGTQPSASAGSSQQPSMGAGQSPPAAGPGGGSTSDGNAAGVTAVILPALVIIGSVSAAAGALVALKRRR